MKTQLDIHEELLLQRLCDEDFLTVWVRPMAKGKHNRKLSLGANTLYRVEFRDAADYIVLQEATDVLLGLEFVDQGHLSETRSTEVTTFLRFQDLFPGSVIRHFVLRTAHSVVHVFSETAPQVLVEDSKS